MKKANKPSIEFEVKVLNIDPVVIAQKLRSLSAKETPEITLKRWVFDMDPPDPEWIRIRTNGTDAHLTYKHRKNHNTAVGETEEIEVTVSDFETTVRIFQKLPFKRSFYQENKRHLFVLDEIEFSLDTWPMLEPFLEIEAKSEQKVLEGLSLLGLAGKDVGDMDVKDIYLQQEIDIHSFPILKFD